MYNLTKIMSDEEYTNNTYVSYVSDYARSPSSNEIISICIEILFTYYGEQYIIKK